MFSRKRSKRSKLQRFLSALNLVCVLAFMFGLYFNMRGFLADLYINLLFILIADVIVFTFPISRFEAFIDYTVVSVIRYMMLISTVIFIAMAILSIMSVTSFTLSLVSTTVRVEFNILSNLISVGMGASTLLVYLMFEIEDDTNKRGLN